LDKEEGLPGATIVARGKTLEETASQCVVLQEILDAS